MTVSHEPRKYSDTVRMMACKAFTLPPATHTNVYAVGSRQALLIDPAPSGEREIERLVRWIEQLRDEGLRFTAILATHHHPDHAGGARQIKKRLRLPLWAHAQTIAELRFKVDVERALEDGDRIELDGPLRTAVTAVHTPGHARGHLCFLEERTNALIAGDMVASQGFIIISPSEGDMAEYLCSLERMRDLKPSVLLPAHGKPIRDPASHIDLYISHRLQREQKVLDALKAYPGPARPGDLLRRAYDDTPQHMWPFAVQSAESHLIKLQAEGRVKKTREGWLPVA